ncbi:MAG TPA: R3H domain-containing nucleic acid-binding protein [Dehalococcoidales bacterium]|nr:R3H domain-containing nucleic acid-binding protein [Dehalococcoidales bacterium]
MQKVITDDLDALLEILPPQTRQKLQEQEDFKQLIEVILDLGRPAEARFLNREVILDQREVTDEDIEYVITRIGSFGDDNRAGIERTLHRISAIRNRKGRIVGLTLRVGRAVFGTIKIIEDLVETGKSILLLGRPGVGKTTMLREVARVLADDFHKRVIIVDTSNEIAGDGDIPHPAIGHARRMQVTTPNMQHAVMIEAVENHMPEVIVIDEIGTQLETQAARTIAERGVQLVATAHGNTLENLMMNPTLADLIGGIQSVTLGDEEAKRRGTQKSILERMSAPTFDILVEIQERDIVAIHTDVASAVDAILLGEPQPLEVRQIDENTGEVNIKHIQPETDDSRRPVRSNKAVQPKNVTSAKLFLYGVNRVRMEEVAGEMGVNLDIVEDLREATLLVTSKKYYRQKPQKIRDAESTNLPIYVLKGGTPVQIRQLLSSLFHIEQQNEPDERRDESFKSALDDANEAVQMIKKGENTVELSPQSAYIRRFQHLVAERHGMYSQSTGKDPNRRVRIFRV